MKSNVQQPRWQSSQTDDEPPSRPGTESIQHLKQIGSTIGSFALKPLRDFALAEKLNAINIDLEEQQQQRDIENHRKRLENQDRERREKERASELLAQKLQDEEDQHECERMKNEADRACQRVGRQYDSLVKFIERNPTGTYDEFIEFLLVDGDRKTDDNGNIDNDYNALLFENFYDENSPYRKLWNDNLTLGLSDHASTIEGRHFVAAIPTYDNGVSNEYHVGLKDSSLTTRERTNSENEKLHNLGQIIQERTSYEGERIKNQIKQIDKTKLKQQAKAKIGSAFNMVSNIALKPLRDMEMAEKLNAMNIDMEDAKAQREIDQHRRNLQEQQELEEMMRIKKEAEESCLEATKDHLLEFLRRHPNATYASWIEDLHPENAHAGTLLEGLSKTIDHRFFVEESDHRRLWNDNLHMYSEPNSKGRSFVAARPKQLKENGEYVDAEDLLSGGNDNSTSSAAKTINTNAAASDLDLINFD